MAKLTGEGTVEQKYAEESDAPRRALIRREAGFRISSTDFSNHDVSTMAERPP